ncbi:MULTISPECIES: ShlB/FhaC/HecB family hemolysin secretion/activation protein [unclassified Oceanobacter]|uniref:ShlB/FhaC/HecB family hemolysin secretion/activation protein n=1 Tax=unclassified Oceanobacter TaxID=2620260 RepID=UPI00273778A2|nr:MULTISPECIES: ShlB/FhaC/HecB family hemolysin secretion/activation protein [unclassified Oceanobacter]MDP2506650.1 ShlB/FhaC/HecB family hemolysin secretion/activation protein [Oceanobacter sp. 3_MG-2023]MDP2548683.1 ShlB/FhaC/HecB family hemolysin secretion/activation protein [Oceanobacter sp. 4_MG-2023]
MNRLLYRALLLLPIGILPTAVMAQTAPAGDQVLREIQPAAELPAPRELDLTIPAMADPVARSSAGTTMQIVGFRFIDNQVFSDAELSALLADLAGSMMGLGDLEGAAARVTHHYRDHGYPLTRVVIPAQTIQDGIVDMQVLEGRLGELEVTNNTRLRSFGQAPLTLLQSGDAIRTDALERALLLTNERAGVNTHAVLSPGSSTGLTDLLVTLEPEPALQGQVSIDNGGNRFTGSYRSMALLKVNNLLGLGERVDLNLVGSNGNQQYYYGGIDIPVGRWGTSIGGGYSWLTYELGEDFSYLDSHGSARSGHLFVRQPLIAHRDLWLDVKFDRQWRRLHDQIDLADSESKNRYRVNTLTLEGNNRDHWFGGGMNAFALGWGHGSLNMLNTEDKNSDKLGAQAIGGFNTVRPTLVRLQRLDDRFSLFARLRGQWADGNLGGGEKFSLGGSSGVRAYPQGEAQGDLGWLATTELRYNLNHYVQLNALFDYGAVTINKDRWDDSDNHRHLSSVGVSAVLYYADFTVDISSSWKAGSEAPESDDDKTPRIWAQASWTF